MCGRWWGCSCGRFNPERTSTIFHVRSLQEGPPPTGTALANHRPPIISASGQQGTLLATSYPAYDMSTATMPTQTLKLFYKGSKLSTLHSSNVRQTVFSTNNQNLCEITSSTSQARLLATDAQASTVNTGSEKQTTITYGPYGNDNCPPANPLLSRFTGQGWLPSAIGYLLGNGHRLFNPGLMRFHSADSLSPFGKGGINAYAYCTNDPINRWDPSGMYSLVKLITGKYRPSKITPRLELANPNLTKREFKTLQNHIAYQQKKATREMNAHYSELRETGENRALEAARQQSILDRLTPMKMKGEKTRYVGTNEDLSTIRTQQTSHSIPSNRRGSNHSVDSITWEELNYRADILLAQGRSHPYLSSILLKYPPDSNLLAKESQSKRKEN